MAPKKDDAVIRCFKQHPGSGFTLIEVLVAITVFAAGFLGAAALIIGIIRGNSYSQNVTSATVVAETQLEEMQNSGYANANMTNFPATPVAVSMGGVSFSRTTTITNNLPATNMKTISVTVNWNEANNVARSLTLNTILAE